MWGKQGVFFVDYIITESDLLKSRGGNFIGKEIWTEPTVDNFGKKMMEVYENKNLKEQGYLGSIYVKQNCQWSNIAERIITFFRSKNEE